MPITYYDKRIEKLTFSSASFSCRPENGMSFSALGVQMVARILVVPSSIRIVILDLLNALICQDWEGFKYVCNCITMLKFKRSKI